MGLGFPTLRGGILLWSDSLEMAKMYERLGTRFQPTEQMRKLATEVKAFTANDEVEGCLATD